MTVSLALFLVSGFLFAAFCAYWLVRQHRLRPPAETGEPLIRVAGVIEGPGAEGEIVYAVANGIEQQMARPFRVRHARGVQEVRPDGAVLEARGRWRGGKQVRVLRVGDAVTLYATEASLARAEAHYRTAARARILDAVRIVRGVWPDLRWARRMAGAGCAVGLIHVLGLAALQARQGDGLCREGRMVAPPAAARAGGAVWCAGERGKARWLRKLDERGHRLEEGWLRQGRRQGRWGGWWPNGQKKWEGAYRDGKRVGTWLRWYQNGRLEWRVSYRHGVKHGMWSGWWSTGQKWQEGLYENGKRHGTWPQWDRFGNLLGVSILDHGTGLWTRWYETGKRAVQGMLRDGKEEGVWTTWHPNGQRWTEVTYRGGKRHGPYRAWYASGAQAQMGFFLDGKRHGRWVFFGPTGRSRHAITYARGKVVPGEHGPTRYAGLLP